MKVIGDARWSYRYTCDRCVRVVEYAEHDLCITLRGDYNGVGFQAHVVCPCGEKRVVGGFRHEELEGAPCYGVIKRCASPALHEALRKAPLP